MWRVYLIGDIFAQRAIGMEILNAFLLGHDNLTSIYLCTAMIAIAFSPVMLTQYINDWTIEF